MPDTDDRLLLWTCQDRGALDRLAATGRLTGDPSYVFPPYRDAYRWMMAHLRVKVGQPPHPNAVPIWSWHQYDGVARKRPDLRTGPFRHPGSHGVCIAFRKRPQAVLRSDYQKWHLVLNASYLGLTVAETDRFDDELAAAGLRPPRGPLPEPFRTRVRGTWPRVFDVDGPPTDAWEPPEARQIQAVCWTVEAHEVVDITPYRAW